jgi:hypothetical protein
VTASVEKRLGLKPRAPDADWGSGSTGDWRSCSFAGCCSCFLSVTVLADDACEGESLRFTGGGEGALESSSSGFAMRRPPSDCDRLKSPFMADNERREEGRGRERTARGRLEGASLDPKLCGRVGLPK